MVSVSVTFLTGCFTGIETTPKITEKDVRREHIEVTPERLFADSLHTDAFSLWRPGRLFAVTDARLGQVFDGLPRVTSTDTLVYVGVKNIKTIMGDSVARLVFTVKGNPESGQLFYRAGSDVATLMEHKSFTVPFTVDLDMVARIDSKLVGRRCYITTSLWQLDADRAYRGNKYVPVVITRVCSGSDVFPLMVQFSPENSDETYYVKMNVADDGLATRCFNTLFSFTDPHLRYPAITDEVWDMIRRSNVKEGMTRDECRLALGTPSDVKKWHNNSVFFERWTYENGSYLNFEDGLLANFRI